jgi:hypothetical protein
VSAKPALEPTLRALVARERRGLSQHPTPETLIAYHARDLPGAEEEELRDHLVLCPECAELLLDLVSFAEFSPPDETAALANSDVEAAWQKVQPQVADSRIPVVRPIREKHREAAGDFVSRRRLQQAYAIAATLFLGVVGLSVWGISLNSRLQEKLAPQSDVPVVHLVPEGEGSRGPEDIKPIPAARSVVVLELLGRPPKEEYGVELLDKAKRSLWISAPLHRFAEDDVVTFGLPSDLPPGDYQAQLFAVEKSGREILTTYKISIAPPAGR